MIIPITSTSLQPQSCTKFPGKCFYDLIRSLLLPIGILMFAWGLIVLFVDPMGEFMVNDDWSFFKTLETLKEEGRMIATGWGPVGKPGGPSLITHLFWGLAFTKIFGFSLTTLRISVLIMGIVGSLGLLILLRHTGASRWLALLGALAVVFNPLFLSQCFTFMTDITFATITIFSVLLLHLGVERSRLLLIIIGLLLALASILTRQIGIVIPLGFMAACLAHSRGRELGRAKMVLLSVGITFIPWAMYEFYLYISGSTPVSQHQVVHNILSYPLSKGFLGYVSFLFSQLLIALAYTCFLVSPVLAVRYWHFWQRKDFRYLFVALTAAFLLVETVIITDSLDLPMRFYRNIIYNFGIGPILLKDIYILGIQRTATIPKPLYYLLIYWAALAVVAVIGLGISSLRRLLSGDYEAGSRPISFIASFSLLAALAYLGIILLTGFHDRYLIPVCILFIIWLITDMPSADASFSLWKSIPALVPLLLIAVTSVPCLSDFMETKRSLQKAHDYLVSDLKVDPCHIDGGFEFNGYHCHRKDFKPRKDLSWWWVTREDYLITLGPLRGYSIIKTFPFKRYIGPDGAIHILQPGEKS